MPGYEDVKDGAYAAAFETMLNATVDYIEDGVVDGKYTYNEDAGEYDYYDTGKEIRQITLAEFLIALGTALQQACGCELRHRYLLSQMGATSILIKRKQN